MQTGLARYTTQGGDNILGATMVLSIRSRRSSAAVFASSRPILHGLANAGASGVAHVIRLLRDELEMAMALSGCRTLADAPHCLGDSPL